MYRNHIEHYKKDAEQFDYFELDKFMEQEFRRRYEAIFNLYKVQSGDNILEIGSGGGLALRHVSKTDCSYFPLDITTSNLRRIRQTAKFDIFPITGDVYKISSSNYSFDFVILSEVLEHLADPSAALQEITRVLKLGGIVIISVPYKEKLKYQLCIHCNKPTPTNAHLHSFDKIKLIETCLQSGLRINKTFKILNAIPNRLHINRLLKHCPYWLWKMVDQSFNFLVDKPASLIVVGEK